MAQFVVIWSIFLYASCLLLLSSAEVPQQPQQFTKVPLVSNNVVEMVAGVSGQGGVGVGVGVTGGVGAVIAPSVGSVAEEERVYYHPAAVSKPRVIDQYDHRSLDGHFEYRYLLSNGEARYERAYWLPAGKNMVLARKGYYSYPISNNKFLTVFYTADQNGYRQDSTTFSRAQPHLPRSIEVPEYVLQSVYAAHPPVIQHQSKPYVHPSTTTSRPFVPSTDNPFIQLKPQVPAHQSAIDHGQPLYGHQSQAQHSSLHTSSSAHSSVGGQVASGIHSSIGAHHSAVVTTPSVVSSSTGVHINVGVKPAPGQVWDSSVVVPSSSNVVSSSGIHYSSGVHSQAVHPTVPSQSAVHSSSVVQHGVESHSQVGAHPTVPVQSAVLSSWGGQSSGSHSQAGVHLEVPTASTVHSSVSAYSPPPVHSPSVVQPSTGVHSAAVPPSRPTVRPSNQVYQYQSASQGSSAQSSVVVPPTVASPTVPVQSWHYSF
ncbi:uncharacterized protein [Bactrocera oleae]|uniref:uncharacterized protein n=1 Tax=Bactrocera oleae TaxID=104688 RepID=UPI00387ECA75